MELNDIIFVEWCGEILRQEVCITLSFEVFEVNNGDEVPVVRLLEALRDGTIANIMNQLSEEFTTTEIRGQNLTNVDDFAVLAVQIQGSETATAVMPQFVALGLKRGVSTKATRPGSIRIPGIIEGDVDDGVWANTAKSDDIATNLNSNVTATQGIVQANCRPIVIGRTPEGNFDLTRINQVNGFGNPRVTTQNSRKR